MNYVSFSPHFPPNYHPFCAALRRLGVNVLGLADAPWEALAPQLQASLSEYYRVQNPLNYDELLRAVGHFTHRWGRIDRLESHNEFWLESDARLRTDFNIPGLHSEDMARVKRKSEMKKVFNKARVDAARGRVIQDLDDARAFAAEVGFPVIAKPDVGVGANSTYRFDCPADMEAFFAAGAPCDYIFEEFIAGQIVSYDGLTGQDGRIVFDSSFVFNTGVMESVNQQADMWYYSERAIPADLQAAGRKIIRTYKIRERFFHLEFFRRPGGGLTALEVNMRPPGGMSTDLWNYANDIDIYQEYANLVVKDSFTAKVTRPYHAAYIGRRSFRSYRRPLEEILASCCGEVLMHMPISGVFAPALGDYGILVRSPNLERILEIARLILET